MPFARLNAFLLKSIVNVDSGITSSPTLSPPSFQSRVLSGHSFAEPLQYDEASLLMHYLDHVFPYQYPCFDKGRWSRGWLLWLLSKNGPLYRASLGLAALHQRSLLGETSNHHLELEFHTKAVRQLHDFITSIDITELQPENETLVEIVTCGVTLISFEVNTDMAPCRGVEAVYLVLTVKRSFEEVQQTGNRIYTPWPLLQL